MAKPITMTINFNKHFKTVSGTETSDLMYMVVAQILFNYGHDTMAKKDDKLKAYFLSQSIMRNPDAVNVTSEDATFIKKACSESLTAGGYGQVYETIENR